MAVAERPSSAESRQSVQSYGSRRSQKPKTLKELVKPQPKRDSEEQELRFDHDFIFQDPKEIKLEVEALSGM